MYRFDRNDLHTFCISMCDLLYNVIGKYETLLEKFRSVLAQLEYQHQINLWHMHLYVPEVHPATDMGFCEREDEGHVFKVNTYNFEVYISVMGLIIYVPVDMHLSVSFSTYSSALARA